MSPRGAHRFEATVAAAAILALAPPAVAFCGFYVAKADSRLFNKASKVVLSWDSGKTAVTMANDHEGDPKEFAVVIPVPAFIERKQIGVVDMKTIDHLDAFTVPRLVEYFNPDPCAPAVLASTRMAFGAAAPAAVPAPPPPVTAYKGVTVEATYDVAEYDVSILSAKESDGLVDFLTDNGYRLPDGAEAVLGSYIKQKMHFFIAKVNLDRMALSGRRFLRPLQVRYGTAKFMLPLRLGTLNANGPQDLIVLALTRKGRVETTNYQTKKLPTGMEVPLYVRDDFAPFYRAMFDRAVERADMRAVFLEYAWDMGWCDPCAAEPLKNKELVELGARWISSEDDQPFQPTPGADAFVTRLHVRYDAAHFPEDLAFMETKDRENFQGGYILQHPWQGTAACAAGDRYWHSLPDRYRREADTLASRPGQSDGLASGSRPHMPQQRLKQVGTVVRPSLNTAGVRAGPAVLREQGREEIGRAGHRHPFARSRETIGGGIEPPSRRQAEALGGGREDRQQIDEAIRDVDDDEAVGSELVSIGRDRLQCQQMGRYGVGAEGIENDERIVSGIVRQQQPAVAQANASVRLAILQKREVTGIARHPRHRRIDLVEGPRRAARSVAGDGAGAEADHGSALGAAVGEQRHHVAERAAPVIVAGGLVPR